MKNLIAVLFLLFGMNNLVFAQFSITAFPFASRNFDVKSLSLGSATVSLTEYAGNTRINPTVVGEEGVLHLSPDWSTLAEPQRGYFREYRLNANYSFGNSALGLLYQRMETGEQKAAFFYEPAYGQKYNTEESFTSIHYSHKLNNNIILGTSLNFLYGGSSSGSSISARITDPVDSWSVDFGIQYQFSKKVESLSLQPSFGISLTNFGKPVEYFDQGRRDPLPTKLQAGFGIKMSSKDMLFERKKFEVTILQNASKIMARIERNDSDSNSGFSAMNPFQALLKSWGSIRYFDGQENVTASPIEQIWWHSGVELTMVETLSLRLGFEQAGKWEERLSYWSIGAGIDLYYLVLDYAYLYDTYEADDYGDYFSGSHWQLTGRIPLNGKKPDTILHEIFR